MPAGVYPREGGDGHDSFSIHLVIFKTCHYRNPPPLFNYAAFFGAAVHGARGQGKKKALPPCGRALHV